MCLEKKSSNSEGHTCTGKRSNLRATAISTVTATARLLEGVGYVEYDRGHWLHHVHAEHIDNKIVVAETTATFAKYDLVVPRLRELLHDVLHLVRREELRFLDVYDSVSTRHRDYEICLTSEESWQLNDVANFSDWRGLVGFV